MPPFPEPGRLGVKICGITTAAQAAEIIALGADALGLNFWPLSKRHLPPAEAAAWVPGLRDSTTLVGVLVNSGPDLISQILDLQLAHILQLHGDETPDQVAALMDRGIPVIKALQVRDPASLEEIGRHPCRTLLLDAWNPGQYGGGGATFPWELFQRAKEMFPEKQLILSGGLTPANIRQAIEETRPDAVDVASGVEASPGRKDLDLVKAFIENVRPSTPPS